VKKSKVLTEDRIRPVARVPFDPTNVTHRRQFYQFFQTMRWGSTGCPFLLEDTYESIPSMCTARLMEWWYDRDLEVA
jgi:hypothetical protein